MDPIRIVLLKVILAKFKSGAGGRPEKKWGSLNPCAPSGSTTMSLRNT